MQKKTFRSIRPKKHYMIHFFHIAMDDWWFVIVCCLIDDGTAKHRRAIHSRYCKDYHRSLDKFQRQLHQRKIPRCSLLDQSRSAWCRLYESGNDQGVITLTGFDHVHLSSCSCQCSSLFEAWFIIIIAIMFPILSPDESGLFPCCRVRGCVKGVMWVGGRHPVTEEEEDDDCRGSSGSSPAIFFSSENSSLANLQKFWWCYGQTALPKFCLADFWLRPPLNAIAIITNSPVLVGGYSPPCAMDRRIIAMLEHHEFPGWCSNNARFFGSASPAVISGRNASSHGFSPRKQFF